VGGDITRFVTRYLRAASGATVALSVGLLSYNGRQRVKGIAAAVGHREFHGRLPKMHLKSLLHDDEGTKVFVVSRARWNVSLMELVLICRLARRACPEAVFEFGTFNGRTTLHLAANLPKARLVTLDLPRERGGDFFGYDPGGRFRGTPEAARITQIWGDSLTMDFSPLHGQFDFIFIDAGHAYENVINDSLKALPLLRGGKGMIVWHDYESIQGVTPALDHLYLTDARFGGLRHIAGTSLAILRL